jgi:hypothetical protein
MRLYNRKNFDTGLRRRFRSHQWGRDAIVWDVDAVNHIVRCKVQGSDKFVHAHYPRNWQTLPEYVRPGNAVRIAHKAGYKGFIEVIGHGRAIPSPVSGESGQFPGWGTYADEIISGGEPAADLDDMLIEIDNMTFRLNGTLHGLLGDNMVMGAGTVYMTDPPVTTMGVGGVTVAFSAAPAIPYARYDLVVVGEDDIVDVVKGVADTEDLQMPSIPANHIKICHVLILGGITAITSDMINALWENRIATVMSLSLSGAAIGFTSIYREGEGYVMFWSAYTSTPYCAVNAKIKDQYGWDYDPTENLDQTAFTFQLHGTGTLCKNIYGPFATTQVVQSYGGNASVTYKRNQNLGQEIPPSIVITTKPGASFGNIYIQLLDSNGLPIGTL